MRDGSRPRYHDGFLRDDERLGFAGRVDLVANQVVNRNRAIENRAGAKDGAPLHDRSFIDSGISANQNFVFNVHRQVGRNCHISAGSQIGGVLEPVGELPVIIEDEGLIGGNSGVYEGTVVKRRAVLGTGTILNRSIPVYDLVRDKVYTASETEPLIIPEEAIVVPGSRAVSHPSGAKWGLALQAAVIVKYRDSKTDARVQLEDLLR